jgi:hypothetical protein
VGKELNKLKPRQERQIYGVEIFLPPLPRLGDFCPADPRLKPWAIAGRAAGAWRKRGVKSSQTKLPRRPATDAFFCFWNLAKSLLILFQKNGL